MYRSTDANGAPVAVTGTYIEPTVRYRGGAERPLVAFAPGTQGQADSCAPSVGLGRGLVSWGSGGTNLSYELPGIAALVGRGVAVVVTDYVGLGTRDRVHTYLNRVDLGHAVLDAARAARSVPGGSVSVRSPVGTFGYSQGGMASGAAAELAPTYAPELNLKGAYVGGPPADLLAVLSATDGTALTEVIGYVVNGLMESYPTLRPIIEAEISATGRAVLARLSRQCGIDGMVSVAFQRSSRWTRSGTAVPRLLAQHPTLRPLVDAQRLGTLQPTVPVRVLTATRDDIVPHAQAKQLAIDWCSLGAKVTYTPVRQTTSTGGTGLNHVMPVFTEGSRAQAWLLARMRDDPITSNCDSLPRQP